MTTASPQKNESQIDELLTAGSDIIGAAVGGVGGFFLGGPGGAAAGGAGGVAISKGLKWAVTEIKQRLLGKREEQRIGATMIYAVEKIQSNLKSKEIRDDDFFEGNLKDRSCAEELFEATLMAAQRDPQEKKLKYYGNLLGNIPFSKAIDRSQANHLIKIAQDLSWNQLCLLAIAVRKNLFKLRTTDYRNQKHFSQAQIFLMSQMVDLHSKGLINFSGEAVLGLTDANPGKMTVQGVGAHLYNLMELVQIPVDDLKDIADSLS